MTISKDPVEIEQTVSDAMLFALSFHHERKRREYPIDKVVKELREAIGDEYVNTNEAVRAVHSKNIMSTTSFTIPDMIVQPTSTEDMQAIIRIANKYRVPVTVQGGGTGFAVTIPHIGGMLIDVNRMNRIIEIDEDADFAVVEPGVTYLQFCTELAKHGYGFPHGTFPPMSCVIANLLGIHGLHRPHIYPFLMLNAQVVLGDGRLLVMGSDHIPDWTQGIISSPAGPGFLRLFRRSAGTLGIVTRAAVRIFPELEAKKVVTFGFSKYDDYVDFAMKAVRNWLVQDIIAFLWSWPMMKKHYTKFTKRIADISGKSHPLKNPPEGVPYNFCCVLIEGIEEDVANREHVLEKLAKEHNGWRIPDDEIKSKWPWFWEHIEVWWLKDLPIFLEPYVNVQGTTIPFYSLVQGPTRAKRLEKYLVDALQNVENEHPQWAGASGYLSWPYDNGRRWFIRCLSWFEEYSDDPEEMLELRSEAAQDISAEYMPYMIANYGYQGCGWPISMELAIVGASLEPSSAITWLKIKKALDPNNILNPYVTDGVRKYLIEKMGYKPEDLDGIPGGD